MRYLFDDCESELKEYRYCTNSDIASHLWARRNKKLVGIAVHARKCVGIDTGYVSS